MFAKLGVRLGMWGLVAVGASHLYAQAAPPSAAGTPNVALIASAKQALESADPSQVREALETLAGSAGGENVANAVVARLRRGLPPQLIEQAIDTLVLLDKPSAGPALLELTQHRRMQIRVKAIAALAALHVRNAQSALLYALDDPSGEVRSSAVHALAQIGNTRALPALLTAAERGVPGAWQAGAQLVPAGSAKQFFERASKADVVELRAALDTLLARQNLPLEVKLRTVAWVRERGTVAARACLLDWLAALPVKAQPSMRTALLKAVEDIDHDHPELKAQLASAREATR